MTAASEQYTRVEIGIAGLGAVVLFLILCWPAPTPFVPYLHPLASAAATLKGAGPASDLAQDIVGFRALIRHDDPYPVLGPAVETLGLDWPVEHVSTHPPTAFVLVAPIAMFPWPLAAMLWAWLMLGCLATAFRLYGLPWLAALGLAPIVLLWPPVSTSLGQFTIIWLLGVGYAYHHGRDHCFLSGLGVGLAALPKFLPALMIVLFLSKPRRRAVAGLASVALASLAVVQGLFPGALERYAQANRLNALAMIARADNASLPGAAQRVAGGWGVIAVVGFLALILWANRGAVPRRKHALPVHDVLDGRDIRVCDALAGVLDLLADASIAGHRVSDRQADGRDAGNRRHLREHSVLLSDLGSELRRPPLGGQRPYRRRTDHSGSSSRNSPRAAEAGPPPRAGSRHAEATLTDPRSTGFLTRMSIHA